MRTNHGLGEDMRMTEPRQDVGEVQARLEEIQRRKRPGIRWHISKHTAEMALDAFAALDSLPAAKTGARSSKRRRRKRAKRLL